MELSIKKKGYIESGTPRTLGFVILSIAMAFGEVETSLYNVFSICCKRCSFVKSLPAGKCKMLVEMKILLLPNSNVSLFYD